jgi:hypothetical protein
MTTSQAPPQPTTLGVPWKGVLTATAESKTAVPVRLSQPSSIIQPEAASATMTCSYIVGCHRWTIGRDNLVRDVSATILRGRSQGPPLREGTIAQGSEERAPQGHPSAGKERAPQAVPIVSTPGMAGHPCATLGAISLSLQGEPACTGKG